ncbi:uncharacterized protein LOC124902474 [Homo sapiens]|uniref:uncharacterized protein LOC124902474 n=1 Tax=Homo sapiens TaxID=9606 RepID=UPI001FB0711C|nr:uncharacterized protein LOC124902474 [Homo sapiens]XP_047301631.1 uncharacterized protein LOC124902474 [Homo sapiens]
MHVRARVRETPPFHTTSFRDKPVTSGPGRFCLVGSGWTGVPSTPPARVHACGPGLPWNHLCNAAPSTLPQPHGAGAPVALCNCLFLCASAPPTLGALEGRARMLVNPVRTASPEEPLGAYTAQACLHQVHGASTAQTG